MDALWISIGIYNLALVLALLFWAYRNSRAKLFVARGLPPELLKAFPKLSPEETKRAFAGGIPLFAIALTYPLGFALWLKFFESRSFLDVWFPILILLFSYNVIDLVLIDWIVLCFWTPRWMVVPGTEGHPGYKNYGYHFKAFWKGMIFVLVASLVFAGISEAVFASVLALSSQQSRP